MYFTEITMSLLQHPWWHHDIVFFLILIASSAFWLKGRSWASFSRFCQSISFLFHVENSFSLEGNPYLIFEVFPPKHSYNLAEYGGPHPFPVIQLCYTSSLEVLNSSFEDGTPIPPHCDRRDMEREKYLKGNNVSGTGSLPLNLLQHSWIHLSPSGPSHFLFTLSFWWSLRDWNSTMIVLHTVVIRLPFGLWGTDYIEHLAVILYTWNHHPNEEV